MSSISKQIKHLNLEKIPDPLTCSRIQGSPCGCTSCLHFACALQSIAVLYRPLSRAVLSSRATLVFRQLAQVREQESGWAEDSGTRKTTCPRLEIGEGAGAVPGSPWPQRGPHAGTPSLGGGFSECPGLHHATHLPVPKGMCKFSPLT